MPRSLLAALFFASVLAWAADAPPASGSPTPSATETPPATPEEEEFVFFNVKSKKFHCAACSSAQKCTKNCSYVELSKALAAGGTPCRRCNGTCR